MRGGGVTRSKEAKDQEKKIHELKGNGQGYFDQLDELDVYRNVHTCATSLYRTCNKYT